MRLLSVKLREQDRSIILRAPVVIGSAKFMLTAVRVDPIGLGPDYRAEIPHAVNNCGDLYYDRVAQIRMNAWSCGRVALVGDAALCVSLLAGQGSALAMTAAYILAWELAMSRGQPQEAFRQYEERLRPFIKAKQRAAERFATAFVPRTPFGLFVRNQVLKAFKIPTIARISIGRDIRDQLLLPQYPS